MITEAIEMLKTNKLGVLKLNKHELLAVTANAVVIRSTDECNRSENNYQQDVLAVRVNGQIVGNSDRIQTKTRRDVLNTIQRPLSDIVPMIPFNVMKQAGLSVKDFVQVDSSKEETVYVNAETNWRGMPKAEFEYKITNAKNIKIISENKEFDKVMIQATWQEPRHFTGARLFKIKDQYFLMDIDRNEIQHGIFNPFLVNLPKACSTIAEAYESLKPEQVKNAEAQGLTVTRQGEWFFIPTEVVPILMNQGQDVSHRGALRAGNNRPNIVEFHTVDSNGIAFVKGEVSHQGREHKTIELNSWHIAIPNTSVTSWQLNGDID